MQSEKQTQCLDQWILDPRLPAEGSNLSQHVEPDTLSKARVNKLTQRLDHMIPDPVPIFGTGR